MQINEILWPDFLGVHDIDLGLDSVLAFADKVGSPEKYIKNIIHVAGTNGKGSTIAFLESMLRSLGYSVNVYSSPHLVHFKTVNSVVKNSLSSNFPPSLTFSPAIMALLLLQTGHSRVFCSMFDLSLTYAKFNIYNLND